MLRIAHCFHEFIRHRIQSRSSLGAVSQDTAKTGFGVIGHYATGVRA